MKELSEFLNEREIYILENYPRKTLKALGEELGITNVRVKRIRDCAKRKIREQKRIEQEQETAPVSISHTLQRRDAWVLLRALEQYNACIYDDWYVDPERVKMEPDYMATKVLLDTFREALKCEAPDCRTGDHVSDFEIKKPRVVGSSIKDRKVSTMGFMQREISDREVISIMEKAGAEEREAQKNACTAEEAVENEVLEALQEELEQLLGEMMALNSSEPVSTSQVALKRREVRRNLLKEQISEVETEIAKLDDAFVSEE